MQIETDLRDPTIVTFAGGSLAETARVAFAAPLDGQTIIITDRTPFHPQSLTWPDQPGDRGTLQRADGQRLAVLDCREAILNRDTGLLATGDDALALKRNDPDLVAVVLHVVANADTLRAGETVALSVDQPWRDALSLQHTGVHLAALALNRCAAAFWTKPADSADGLGAPDFDKAAVSGSTIKADRSVDTYRIGKSLRKKGFERDTFLADLPARSNTINATLHEMLATPAPVILTPAEGSLGDRRLWSTRLDGTSVEMPCGGTHVADLAQIGTISVTLETSDDGFVMTTTSRARQ